MFTPTPPCKGRLYFAVEVFEILVLLRNSVFILESAVNIRKRLDVNEKNYGFYNSGELKY